VNSQDDVNKIWDAIKSIPEWRDEIVADIKATGKTATATANTYTVKSGDTLSKIAKTLLGDLNVHGHLQRESRSAGPIRTRLNPDRS
jgi:LysM repeat protein